MGPSYVVPGDLLRRHDADLVCKYLCLFIMETRRENGKMYPPSSFHCLVSEINRVLQANNATFLFWTELLQAVEDIGFNIK